MKVIKMGIVNKIIERKYKNFQNQVSALIESKIVINNNFSIFSIEINNYLSKIMIISGGMI